MKKLNLIVSLVIGLKNLMTSSKLKLSVFTMLVFGFSVARAQNSLIQSAELTKEFRTADTLFRQPYIDVDEWRDKPARHRYIHGGFTGTSPSTVVYPINLNNPSSTWFVQSGTTLGGYFTTLANVLDAYNSAVGLHCSEGSGLI